MRHSSWLPQRIQVWCLLATSECVRGVVKEGGLATGGRSRLAKYRDKGTGLHPLLTPTMH